MLLGKMRGLNTDTSLPRTLCVVEMASQVGEGDDGVVLLKNIKLDCFKNFFLCLFIFERWEGVERDRDTVSETGSRLQAISTEPDAGLEFTNREIMT